MPAAGQPEDSGGEGEADKDVDEIVIAEIDGGEPKTDAGDGV